MTDSTDHVNLRENLKSAGLGKKCVIGILLTLLVAACNPGQTAFRGTEIKGVDWGKDFVLTSHLGRPLSTEEFRGKVVILFFGYTHCPDICAPTLAKLASLRRQLGTDAAQVQVLFVTVDPRHDTPEQLVRFVPNFDPSFIGFTGTPEQVASVARDYKVSYTQAAHLSSSLPLINHSGVMLVKDRSGRPRLLFKNEMSIADMEHDIRRLLTQ